MTTAATTPSAPSATPADPLALVKTKSYMVLLLFGAIVGVPVAFIAYFFLKWVALAQQWLYSTFPKQIGFVGAPVWWPIPLLIIGGVIVALAIIYLPGTGGHVAVFGFKPGGGNAPIDLPGIIVAAFATLVSGAVLGPEAPLVAMGAGFAVLLIHLVRRDAPAMAVTVIGAAGSFAAISTLLGSPIVAAFLLMEASGLGGPTLALVMLPGLLAAGVGALIFVGLNSWTGYGTFSLAVSNIPSFTHPAAKEFLWAVVIGVAAAVVGTTIRRIGLLLLPLVERRRVLLTPLIGLAVGLLAVAFVEGSGKDVSYMLFSGQSALGPLIQHAGTFSVGALGLLLVTKGLAYGGCLSSFRGGPVFPGLFLGAVGGILLSHLPGLPMIAGAAMGIGALLTVMLNGMPLTSVLLVEVLFPSDAVALVPIVIVAVVTSYVAAAWLAPKMDEAEASSAAAPEPAPAST
ncbi:MAG: chloride channel protein [Acidimicrobiales bacterium]